MSSSTSDFLGQGWAFPVDVNLDARQVRWCAGEEAIRQAVVIILRTSPGERVLAPTFGSHLSELVFSPANGATMKLAELYARQALEQWEPRIDVAKVTASVDPNGRERLLIDVRYIVRLTNRPDNVVYPFYLT